MNETETVVGADTTASDVCITDPEAEDGKEEADEGAIECRDCDADAATEDAADPSDLTCDDRMDPLSCETRGDAVTGASDRKGEGRAELLSEMQEFSELYPHVSYREIPEEVKGSALPLSAAYALYERRCAVEKARADAENRKNAERSAGGISSSGEICYTPEEVRRMTQAEVHRNYDSILRSMRRWV